MTAAAAVKFRPALSAFRFIVNMGVVKLIEKPIFKRFIGEISQLKQRISHKLMTWIDISFRRHCHIFRSRAAAGHALDDTWTLI